MKRKFLIVMAIAALFLLPVINSASQLNKIYDENTSKIKLEQDSKIQAEYTLVENTKQCLINCKAKICGNNYEKQKVLESIKFINEQAKEISLDFQIKINKTKEKENKTEEYFASYDNEEINGSFCIEISGKKAPDENIDWVFSNLGVDFNEWAWWNSSWNRKENITLQENSGSDLNNYTVLINVSYDTDMNSDFSDIRFTNAEETEELNYWIENKTDSLNAWIWVKIPDVWNANTNKTIVMYFNNSNAETTSDPEDTFWMFHNQTNPYAIPANSWFNVTTEEFALYGPWEYKIAQIVHTGSDGSCGDYIVSKLLSESNALYYGDVDCDFGDYDWIPPSTSCRTDRGLGTITLRGQSWGTQTTSGNSIWALQVGSCPSGISNDYITSSLFAIGGNATIEPSIFFGSEESGDLINPNVTIISPSSSVSDGTILINVSATDNTEISYCYYNITRGASVEKENVAFNLSILPYLSDSYTLSGEANYLLNVFCNDSFGNFNSTSLNFTYNGEEIIIMGGGGGSSSNEETEKEFESICIDYKKAFMFAWEESKSEEDLTKRFTKLWDIFWDYALCESAASIVPIQFLPLDNVFK